MSAILRSSQFVAQLKTAEFHTATSWHRELEIVKALKIAYDDENKDDEAVALEKLGDVYNARASKQDESLSLFARLDQFVLAACLYNSSLVRNNDGMRKKELEPKLRRVEEDIISRCCQTTNMSEFQYDIDKTHRSKLNEFRKQCSEKLGSIQGGYSVFTSPLHDPDADSEARRATAIRELFTEIREFMTEAVALLLHECIQVLGPPPQDVGYAFIGFGSFARGEVTPYSDLEFALLIEEDKNDGYVNEYFVKLLEYFNYKVLNLQETILPTMCIPSLNDDNNILHSLERYECASSSCTNKECKIDETVWPFLGKGKEFYDNEMRGFSLDGRMSKACKTPLGRLVQGRGDNKDLIKTPTELAELYVSALKCDSPPVHENYDLSTVLSNVYFLYGNEPDLVDTYDGIVLSISEFVDDSDKKFNPRQSSAIQCLQEALDQFQFSLTSRDIGLISSIKKKLYRAVGMLITNVGKFQFPTVINNSPWNILDRLLEQDIISTEVYHNLSVVVGIVNEVRLMAYLRCGRQDEIFSFFDQSTDINLELVRDLFIRFFYTVFPLQKTVKQVLSKLQQHDSDTNTIQFPSSEKLYEYSHFNSAIALSFTSYRFFNVMLEKFAQAYQSAQNEDFERVCLAYLCCLHPDYTSQYCEKILSSIGDGNNEEWRILTYLIAALASFHQDNITNIEKFLNAATEASKSNVFPPNSTTEVTVLAYNKLISGLLKFRQQYFNDALVESDSARLLYETIMQSRGSVTSLFETITLFLSGNCHIMSGNYSDPSVESAMRKARHYSGNGDYMRILYHIYMLFFQGAENDQEVIRHVEKILELFMRFRCPKGQELWASILAQGIILAALFLGLLYRNTERVDDALRIFRLASSHLVPKALELCQSDEYHVGKINVATARMYIDALKAIFKFAEAECLHFKNSKDEMWICITDALTKLANCRGKFPQIEQRDVFAEAFSLGRFHLRGSGSFPVWRITDHRQHAAPRFLDTLSMAPLLESWCDTLTRSMQYILYTTERDVSDQLLQQGTPLLSQISQNLLVQFRKNPCDVLRVWIPVIRFHSLADQMIGEIFSGVNSQRTTVLQMIKINVGECQQYALEFLDYWKELFFLFLRFSLCHDLLNSLGFLKG